MLSIGACVFALRQLGCGADVISWVQDHAEVTSVACTLSRMLLCKLRKVLPMLLPFAAHSPWHATGTL